MPAINDPRLNILERLRRLPRPRAAQITSERSNRPIVVGGGGQGGLSGLPGGFGGVAPTLNDSRIPPGAVSQASFAGGGGPVGAQPAGGGLLSMGSGALSAAKSIGGLLGFGGGGVGAGSVGLQAGTPTAGGFSFAPSIVGGGAAAPGITGTTAGVVAPGAGLGIGGAPGAASGASAAAPALAAGGLAAAAPALAFGLPAAAAAIYSRTVGPSKARASFKVGPGGEITHRNVKDSTLPEDAAFNSFADWVGQQVADSGAKVPDPGDVSFGVRDRRLFLQPAGGGERQFVEGPRELLSALTEMGGKRRDFSDLEIPDFTAAGRDAATARADELQTLRNQSMAQAGPVGGLLGDDIERLQRQAQTRGIINQPQFQGGGLL